MVAWWVCTAGAGTVAPAQDEVAPTPAPVVGLEVPALEAPEAPEAPAAGDVPRWAPQALTDPDLLPDTPAPETFRVRFDTTAGPFVVEVVRAWAPRGADRFHALVGIGMYDGMAFYRAIEGFVVQWGLSPYPDVNDAWSEAPIGDDPVVSSNTFGRISFAAAGPNTRTTQLFVNVSDQSRLDRMGFAPFGSVVEGMDVVLALHTGYGEGRPRGGGPSQMILAAEGDAYLAASFPDLDLIHRAVVVPITP